MDHFTPVYVPVGVPTFHMESAEDAFGRSSALLSSLDPRFVIPADKLLSTGAVADFLEPLRPDLIVFQNLTFANSAYISEVLRRFDCPVVLWALREPVIDGGRLRLNSLTGAYSAGNCLRSFGDRPFSFVFGSPEEQETRAALLAAVKAAEVKQALRSLKMAAVGHTPQGFGFGRALDSEFLHRFGVELVSIEARELIEKARSYTEEECAEWLKRSEEATCGLDTVPERNRIDHARLLKAYAEFARDNGIGALASRCWPDFFTSFGTPVCTVLSMLNDMGVTSACEADMCGALSMWVGSFLSGQPAFFGDPVSLDEEENTITYWHCGAAACSLARRDTGAAVGVHPNRKIGPVMDFGCEAWPEATVFRIGREADGSYRFFLMEGSIADKPKQFTGTSVVFRADSDCRTAVEKSVRDGFEPHFAVLRGHWAAALTALAEMLRIPVWRY